MYTCSEGRSLLGPKERRYDWGSKLILWKTLFMIISKSVSLEISLQTLRCSDGQWSGEVPTCEQVRNKQLRALCGYFLAGTLVMKG